MPPATVRPARSADVSALGRMGAALAQLHHEFDPARFMLPDHLEEGYRQWLAREVAAPDAVVLVAEQNGEVVGYAYGRAQERDWNALLDRYGAFHDLWVDPGARGSGAGRQLVEALVTQLTALRLPRVVLLAASTNEAAQRLFARLGFRPTMLEMTCETPGSATR